MATRPAPRGVSTLGVHATVVIAMLLISGSYPVGEAIANELDTGTLLFLRFLLALAVFGPVVAWRHGIAWPGWRALAGYAAISASLVAFFWCMFAGLRTTSALNAGAVSTLIPGFTAIVGAALVGEPRLVNVWATWCPTCLTEHDALLRIRAETGLSIVGVNYKDDPALAKQWLARHGDPYDFNIIDAEGDLGVDLGVYGAPETFLLDANAVVRHKHVGAMDAEVWRTGFEPVWRALAAP